jgi:uncharacterized oligopeptide transporter (OPT) family protein
MVVLKRVAPAWADKYGVVLAAGIIAGESVAGVGDAFYKKFGG